MDWLGAVDLAAAKTNPEIKLAIDAIKPEVLALARQYAALGGGCGSSPGWVRIFSITGRSKMAAMILSSAEPQLGQCCVSMSKARLRSRSERIN